MRAGAALSSSTGAAEAAREAAESALAALAAAGGGRVEAGLALTSFETGQEQDAAFRTVADVLGTATLAGAAGVGVAAGQRELEHRGAVVVLALADVEAQCFVLSELAGREACFPADVESALGGSTSPRDLLLTFADPLALDARRTVAGFARRPTRALWVGCGAALGTPGPAAGLWSGKQRCEGSLVGLALRGARPPSAIVAQGCRPVSSPFTVTRSEGHWVLELDGRSALDRYRQVALAPLAQNLRRAADHLLVALPCTTPADAALRAGQFTARPLRGFATDRGAFATSEQLRPGRQLAFALRDAGAAREELKRALNGLGAAGCGIYLSCAGRGCQLFGHEGLEMGYVGGALGATPLAGLFGSFQIGPLAGAPRLLNYAGVLALLEPKP